MSTTDLFGARLDGPPLSDLERKRMRRRASEVPRGYAARPGTGPAGETCGSCRHIERVRSANTYPKCGLNRAAWTCSPRTDIRVRSPACAKWEPAPSDAVEAGDRP